MTDLGNELTDKIAYVPIGDPDVRLKTEPEQLIDLAKENNRFFKDQYGKDYALVKIKDHYESISLDSNRFKSYLGNLFYHHSLFGKPAKKESINTTIEHLHSIAEFEGPVIPLKVRVAKLKDSFYYDLTDEGWNCVRIDTCGWEIIKPEFALFKRYNQTPQSKPEKDYDPKIFDKFMSLTNIKDRDAILLTKVWIISTLIPDILYTILNVHGDQDAARDNDSITN